MAGLLIWLSKWHPRVRRARQKRMLENVCKRHGCSRAVALAIVREYYTCM